MLINKRQGYLLGFLLASSLGANIQSVSAITVNLVNNSDAAAVVSNNGKIPMMLASEHNENLKEENTSYPATKPVLNLSTSSLNGGKLVSTNYNTVGMVRSMEDSQNIGSLGNDANPEPISDALDRELKASDIAFVPSQLCVNPIDMKMLPTCQDKNLGKMEAMPMVYDQNLQPQGTKNFSFWQMGGNSYAEKLSK